MSRPVGMPRAVWWRLPRRVRRDVLHPRSLGWLYARTALGWVILSPLRLSLRMAS